VKNDDNNDDDDEAEIEIMIIKINSRGCYRTI